MLGHRCYDILCGRDIFGNRYCGPACPVAEQARRHPDEPIRPFLADVRDASGKVRRLKIATFPVASGGPATAALAHVLRDPAGHSSGLERDLAKSAPQRRPRRDRTSEMERPAGALTDREQETLRRMSQGASTLRIARDMRISPVTVRNHIARILSKLHVHTKLAAVAYAYRHGLIDRIGPASGREANRPEERRRRGARR